MAPPGPRRGSSSFFDRVRLAVQELKQDEAPAAEAEAAAVQEETHQVAAVTEQEAAVEVTDTGDEGLAPQPPPSAEVEGDGGVAGGEAEATEEAVDGEGESVEEAVKAESETEVKEEEEVKVKEEEAASSSDREDPPPPPLPATAIETPPPAATSPRSPDLFGRFMSAMRNEPTAAASETKRPSFLFSSSAKPPETEKERPGTEAAAVAAAWTEVATASEPTEEEVVAVTSPETADVDDESASSAAAGSDVDAPIAETMESGKESSAEEELQQGDVEAPSEGKSSTAEVADLAATREASSSDVESSSGSGGAGATQQTEDVKPVTATAPEQPKAAVSPPPSSSRLFGRLLSAMRTEQPEVSRESAPGSSTESHEAGSRASITGSGGGNTSSTLEPASTSLFDRLISTVRHEAPAPAANAVEAPYIPHAEITVDDSVSNDSSNGVGDDGDASSDRSSHESLHEAATASKSQKEELEDDLQDTISHEPLAAEAAAIEEMVELTLDVGGDDQDEAHENEPSVANDNESETVVEHHSEPPVTNEIDHVEEHYPEEMQSAIKRAGAALLAVLPGQEAAGISVECYSGVERMKDDGEVLNMQFVKELESAGVLMTCANEHAEQSLRAAEDDLAELRVAVATCCTGRLAWTAVPKLLALWAIIHTAVSDGLSDEAGERGTILEPYDIVQAAERKGTLLNMTGIDREGAEKVDVDNSLFDQQIAQVALTEAMAGLQGSLLISRQRLAATLQAMREGRAALVGGCLALVNIPLLRFEIGRDFFQTAGLFLSGMFKPTLEYFQHQQLPEYILQVVRGLRAAYTIIAIDVSAFVQWISKFSNSGVFISIGVVMLIHLFFIGWLYRVIRYMPRGADNVRHGHESMTWASLAATNKRMAMISSLLITASLTVYLPLTQFCFSVLDINAHKHDETPNIEGTIASHFSSKPYWGLIVFEALALLFTFSVPLPFILVSSIRANRPRGSLENAKVTYDLDGEEVPFDDKVYARLVASDPSQLRCPYRSLYNGFEQRWSTYKVMQLVAKAVLAAVVVGSSRNISSGGIVVCGVYFMVVLLTSYSRPFIDPVNDLMESSAKFTALVTAVGGTLGAWAQRNDIHSNYIQGFLGFVLVVHFINLWIMLTVTLLGVANTRTLIKNWLGWLSFSDTTRMIDDARASDIIPSWDLNKEAKHRVWQAFWRAVLYDLAPHEAEQSENHVKESPAAGRLIAQDQAVISAGIRRVSSHWRGKQQRYTTRLRQVVRTALEGIDVYWNEEIGVRDGHLDSMSYFGKLYVVPYPFHCVIVYDNTNDEAIIWDEVDESAPRDSKLHSHLAKLLFLNFSPTVVAKREVRQKIRALADLKTPVRFPFSRVEKAVVTDYYEWTPIEGYKPMKVKYKAVVEFTCHYTYGVFKVKTSGDSVIKGGTKRPMADGFIVTMTYKDGRGYAKAPRTGKRYEITGRKAVRDSDHFGLNPDMEENEHLKQIFEQTRQSWEAGIVKMRAEHREYRHSLIKIHADANDILSDDFWYFVYNNQYLSRKDLEQYLTTREMNPQLRQLPQTHKNALDALYLRQRFIMTSPAHKLWYIFWDDVFARNSEMSRLIPKGDPKPGRACRADFDSNSATSICYSKKSRKDLEAWLGERGLLGKTTMFHPGLLHLLYDELRKLDEGSDPKNNMKVLPRGKSFKRRSMIASMVWRPSA
ncbi:hypothetical protein PR001_g24060 [Phytophthora rubi]|uniref:Uncharacterized protein n=1 Tax=Phytophthora rubi TaxID=129364 RepID=A0A6A3IKZ5_9STRA|nr:hypothetical protein PR001_g24060 [Phytophthora rubi]